MRGRDDARAAHCALLEAGVLVCPVNPTTLRRWRPPSGAKSERATRCFWRARDVPLGLSCPCCNRTAQPCTSSNCSRAT